MAENPKPDHAAAKEWAAEAVRLHEGMAEYGLEEPGSTMVARAYLDLHAQLEQAKKDVWALLLIDAGKHPERVTKWFDIKADIRNRYPEG
jgi:hypothetical protein